MKQQYNVDYNVLKANIIKSCRQAKRIGIEFVVNYDKLSRLVDDIGLKVVNIGTRSKAIKPEDIVSLSEYFKDKKLSWFTQYREITKLLFVRSDSADDKLNDLLNQIDTPIIDNPDIDKVKCVAEIVANYPCYFATVVAYESNDPIRFGKPTYMIGCRANTVTITEENYKYNEKDI